MPLNPLFPYKPPHNGESKPYVRLHVSLWESLKIPIAIVSLFWLVELLEYAFDVNMNFLGIYPRSFSGLSGIITAPFLHSGFSHLISNSPTFIVLGASVIFFYPRIALKVWLYVYLLTNVGVWIFGRESYHVGASGMLYGFAAFLFFSGVFRNELKSLMISLVTAFLYGSMLYGIFPNHPHISYESHLIGALVGVYVAYSYRQYTAGNDEPEELKDEDPNLVFEGYRNLENDQVKYHYKG